MKTRLLTVTGTLFLGLAPWSATYACDMGQEIFYCSTKSKKEIRICADTDKAYYTFGKPGSAPDMALSRSRSELSGFVWDGFGRYMTDTVEFPNKDIVYEIYSGSAKAMTEAQARHPEVYGGVMVRKGEEQIADIACRPNSIRGQIDTLNVRPTNPR